MSRTTSRINEFHYGNSYGSALSLLMSLGNYGTYHDLSPSYSFAIFSSPTPFFAFFSLSLIHSRRLSSTFTFIQLKARKRDSRKTWFHLEWPTKTTEVRSKAALIKSCDFDQLYSLPLLSRSYPSSQRDDRFNFLLFLINSRD